MAYIFNRIVFFNIINFLLLSKEEFIENPIKIIDYSEIDDYIIDENKYFPSDWLITLIKENNYELNYEENLIISFYNIMSLNINEKYNGFIQEQEFNSGGILSNILANEIIIYGKDEQNYLYFKYIKENTKYSINDINNFGEQISCKFLRSSRYVCAYFKENKLYVTSFIRKQTSVNKFSHLDSEEIDECRNYDKFILYDTDVQFLKILCSEVWQKGDGITITHTLEIANINPRNMASLSIIHYCYFIDFYGEFLLCCGENKIIRCFRNKRNDFSLINKFIISLSGDITNILITNKINHAIISYKNESSNQKYLYNYFIYPPQCKCISKSINSYQSFEINLLDLLEDKTNTKYYITFNNLPIFFF